MTAVPSPVTFGDFTADDVDAVVDIERRSFERPWSRNHFLRELDSDLSRTIVARSADVSSEVLGYICRWLVAGEVQILNLAVHPEHRRQGIGRRLMQQVLDEARRAEAGSVTLEVRDDNVEAVALYESFGFERVGRRQGYYGQGSDGVLMTLCLDAASGPERT